MSEPIEIVVMSFLIDGTPHEPSISINNSDPIPIWGVRIVKSSEDVELPRFGDVPKAPLVAVTHYRVVLDILAQADGTNWTAQRVPNVMSVPDA